MNHELEQAVQSDLATGEKLLWSGRPARGIRFRAADAFMVPFSLMWGGFAIFWEMEVFKQGAPGFMVLWGIPFVLVGLYLIIGRFFVDAWQRSRTYYALTSQRALIVASTISRQVKSLPLRTMSDITLIEGAGGSGSITLGPAVGPYGRMGGSGWPGASKVQAPAFEMIDDVRQVYTMLLNAQANAAKQAP